MSRWKAAAIHLSLSALIGLVVAALLFGLWYPPPYFSVAGAGGLIVLLLGVDLALGPLLTLVVFKAGKKSLRFDLAVIAALQLAALGYGLHVITQARPVFIVAVVDRFTLVAANELDPADLARAKLPQFASLSWSGPRLVAAHLPEDSNARNDILFSALAGKDLEKFPEHYVDYASEAPSLLKRAQALAQLRGVDAQAPAVIDAWLQRTGRDEAAIRWLPVLGRTGSLTMLLSASGEVLDALPIDPW